MFVSGELYFIEIILQFIGEEAKSLFRNLWIVMSVVSLTQTFFDFLFVHDLASTFYV